MFGFGKSAEDELSDQALIRAARRRLLSEISQKANAQSVINNVYGGGGGVMDRLGGAPMTPPSSPDEDPYDYLVDITREDLPDVNPATGKPKGWKKSVHRYRGEKKK